MLVRLEDFVIAAWESKSGTIRRVKYWEIIADNLGKTGWSWGYVSTVDSQGRTIWIADAHRDDGQRFVASFILDIAWQRVYERSC